MKTAYIVFTVTAFTFGGAIAGYEVGHYDSKSERMGSVFGQQATQLISTATTLQMFKKNRMGCTKWLIQMEVNATLKNMSAYRTDPDIPQNVLARLERAASLGTASLMSSDKSGIGEADTTCTK